MCCVHTQCIAEYWLFLQLLEARQSVLAQGDVDLLKCTTIDLMSDEEDGRVSGWIAQPM